LLIQSALLHPENASKENLPIHCCSFKQDHWGSDYVRFTAVVDCDWLG